MSRRLRPSIAMVVAASTLLCAGATATATATATESVGHPVVKAFVEYGDPAVSVPPRHRARLSFQGQRGDIVHLSGALGDNTTLRTSGRRLRVTWPGYPDYYRLGADRRYTFSVRPSETDAGTQFFLLEELVVRTLSRDHAVTFGPKRRGFVPAVSFELEPRGRTMITTPAYGSTVLTGHKAQLVYGDPILEAGQRLTTARGDSVYGSSPLRAGRVIVLTGNHGTVRAIHSDITPVTLEGAPTRVDSIRRPHEVALRFSAEAGQLVYLRGVPPTQVSPTMFGATLEIQRAPVGLVWQVAETGTHTVSLFPASGTHFDVGLALVTRIGSMTAGGPAMTFYPPQPGRWVYADVDGGYVPTLTASASTFGTGVPWSASVTTPHSGNCLMPQGPLGCGDVAYATVTEATAQSSGYVALPSTGSFVILQVPPGATGSVDLQVTKLTRPTV
jgi:hypothetical protein